MPFVLVLAGAGRVLLVVCAAMRPEVAAHLLNFGGITGNSLIHMLLYGSEEGAYLNEGLLVLNVAFGEIGEGCGGMVTLVVDTHWLVCCSKMVLKLWLVLEGAWAKLAAQENPEY